MRGQAFSRLPKTQGRAERCWLQKITPTHARPKQWKGHYLDRLAPAPAGGEVCVLGQMFLCDFVPERSWPNAVLHCRLELGQCGVVRPRSPRLWPALSNVSKFLLRPQWSMLWTSTWCANACVLAIESNGFVGWQAGRQQPERLAVGSCAATRQGGQSQVGTCAHLHAWIGNGKILWGVAFSVNAAGFLACISRVASGRRRLVRMWSSQGEGLPQARIQGTGDSKETGVSNQ